VSVEIRGVRIATDGGIREGPLCVREGIVVSSPPPGALAVDLQGHLVFPGLINLHDHLTLNAIPNPAEFGARPNSYAWIEEFKPLFHEPSFAAARSRPERERAWHGGLKNLLAGTTVVVHHDPWCTAFDEAAFPLEVPRRFGWAHSLRLSGDYGPAVPGAFHATPDDAPFFIHLAEGTDEVAGRELAELDALGALGANTVLVHGTGLSPEDVGRVVARGAGVVWCPASNLLTLGVTLAPRRLADAGRLALGTDSRFTGSRDLLAEMKVAAAESDLAPREIVRLVTGDAACLLRRPDLGGLSPGQRADFLVLPDPGGDPWEALLRASRADLAAVVRGGMPRVVDPALAEWLGRTGVRFSAVRLDGRPKALASALLSVPGAVTLEPGLEIS
jgi:cytosine/adenosine deaminase-related metal-dependent hydrolase